MKLDKTFAAELRRLNGDGSREARLETMAQIRGAKRMLSTPEVLYKFNECVKLYGRAVTAVCVAATLGHRRARLDNWGFGWATSVLAEWKNRTPFGFEDAIISDGLHPTRICEYAADLIRLTTEDE